MYKLIEMYDESRQRLLLLSSKQIERMNRMHSTILAAKSEPSLQNFLFALAKERSVLLNRLNGKQNLFKGDTPGTIDELNNLTSYSNISLHLENQVQRNTKRLIEGSTHYLRELSRIYMLAMGPDNFLPQELVVEKSLAEIPEFFS